jgi:type II secretory pathway component PulJ
MMDDGKIDLVRYGVLWQKVENYEQKFDAMERKIDTMESDLKKLVLMAERSKGSLWALMGIAGVIGSIVSFVADFVFVKK